jgi:hypothetical protein
MISHLIVLVSLLCLALNLLLLETLDSLKSFILRKVIASFIVPIFQYAKLMLDFVL